MFSARTARCSLRLESWCSPSVTGLGIFLGVACTPVEMDVGGDDDAAYGNDAHGATALRVNGAPVEVLELVTLPSGLIGPRGGAGFFWQLRWVGGVLFSPFQEDAVSPPDRDLTCLEFGENPFMLSLAGEQIAPAATPCEGSIHYGDDVRCRPLSTPVPIHMDGLRLRFEGDSGPVTVEVSGVFVPARGAGLAAPACAP